MSISPAAYAIALLDKLGVSDVPEVYAVAERLGVAIEERDIESFDGALVRIRGSALGVIALRRSIRETGRKRFTVAHEIGHLILPGHDDSIVCRGEQVESWARGGSTKELEANQFAAELLMPTAVVGRMIGTSEPSFAACEAIASRFGTSLTAAAYKFAEISPHRCAVVWSSAGQIRWFKGSTEFSAWVRIREDLDRRTFAYDAFAGSALPDRSEPVLADAWLDGRFDREAFVLEQSRAMPNYNGVLSLLWLKDNPEALDDDGLDSLDPTEFGLGRRNWPSNSRRHR